MLQCLDGAVEENRLEIPPCDRILRNDDGQRLVADGSVRIGQIGTEAIENRLLSRSRAVDKLSRHVFRLDDGHTNMGEEFANRRFADTPLPSDADEIRLPGLCGSTDRR